MAVVGDLMTEDVKTVHRGDGMDRVYDLMLSLDVRHMPVVDDADELVGLVSHRDVIALLGENSKGAFLRQAELLSDVTAEQAMTRGIETVEPDLDLRTAAEMMVENKYGCLPVCEGTHLVGILTESDFVKYVAEGGS